MQRQYFIWFFNQKQELPVAPCLLMDRDKMSNLYREPAIDASYQVSVHMAKGFQKPLNRFQPNLPEMVIGWSSTRFVFLVLI
jgi:hypothetical protein